MKITKVNVHLMQAGAPTHTAWGGAGKSALASGRNWLFAEIHTEEGLVGLGEGSGWPRVVAAALPDLAPLLVGEDAFQTERLHQKLRVAMMGHGHLGVVGSGALAALDTALWDIKAQALGRPLCDLLGGRVRDTVPYYAHVKDAETARAAVARGVRALKVGGTRQIVERAWAIREAIGPDIDLIVDLHGPAWLTGADAVAVGRALEGAHLLFLEEPVAPDDPLGWRRVRDSVALPLAAGERLGTLAEFDQLIASGLIDVVQPDTGRTGGPTQLKKIAALAEAKALLVAPHSGSLGPVAEFAAVHWMAASTNGLILERLEPDWDGKQAAVTRSLQASDGYIAVPAEVGLGTSLDHAFVAAHPSERNVALPAGGWEPGTEQETPYLQARRSRARLTNQ
ncbi:mandelate racemase/muconate lactonizing enzyme family protein [Cupriavidus pauculus]|uniref:mandelate racemase/muconate lactonizing enzyme family protein n=1 Tax=Cupriavidus pauculus TaxID=82633 RepID=UPI001EE2F97A|nr:mandelate racemase/muconate lactonizing enzyme family protein [Cupriavidus pauculus]GJG95113.1 mandelate racemase/muconate lactonizing enzyme family protein [Cupriavidus pauculus]